MCDAAANRAQPLVEALAGTLSGRRVAMPRDRGLVLDARVGDPARIDIVDVELPRDEPLIRAHDLVRGLSIDVRPECGGGERVRVTVLLGDLEEETIRTRGQAGFQREATADIGSFVIGRVAPDRLEAVAMLPVVRRVEPLE
jgi:hypothetical protein